MNGDDEKLLAAFDKRDEFLQAQNALLSCNLLEEPSMEQDAIEIENLRILNEILDEYQEQSYLLDPYLEELVSPVAQALRTYAREFVNSKGAKFSSARVRRLSLLLYSFTKFRGYKTIVRFFPHEVGDLSVTLDYMSNNELIKEEGQWALRYTMLLWVSLVCMLPFDLSQFDERENIGTTARSIEDIARRHLDKAGLERDGASILLSRLFMRKDTQAQLSSFLDWFMDDFKNNSQPFTCIGVLKALAEIAKSGPAELLQPHIESFHKIGALISSVDATMENTIIRRLRIKLLSRLATRELPAQRGRSGFRALMSTDRDVPNEEDDSEFDIPEDVENVFEELFAGVQDKDTTVRWSSAKGIACISERLPRSFVSQVLEQVLGLFGQSFSLGMAMTDLPSTAEASWHGACLACAEMARRNLVPRQMLPEILDWMMKALYFDVRKGAHSIGSSVRDAASYVLWSLARAQTTEAMQNHALSLAQNLVTVAIYDRETQIRRAASAAFQENVGRMGLFPHGIDVLGNTDFYAISVRRHAFLEAAPRVALHLEYREFLLQHLSTVTLRHWDEAMRQLAAQSLRKVCDLNILELGPRYVSQLTALLKSVDTIDIHGALLGLAELAKGFTESPHSVDLKSQRDTIFRSLDLVPSKLLLTQRNAFLTEAACYLISESISLETISSVSIPSPIPYWRNVIDHSIKHYNDKVHVAAATALSSLSTKHSPNAQRCVSRVLGVLDYSAFPHEINAAVQFLLDGVNHSSNIFFADVEARRNAYTSLSQIIINIIPQLSIVTTPTTLVSILHALNTGLEDYTTNERGDVGSYVRMACIHGLSSMLSALLRAASSIPAVRDFIPPEIYHRSIAGILKQGVERLDNVRQVAGEAFLTLARLPYDDLNIGEWAIHGREFLADLLNMTDDAAPNWGDGEWLYPRAVHFLDIAVYRSAVLRGLVLSVGSKTGSTQRPARASLVDYVASLHTPVGVFAPENPYDLFSIANDLLSIAEEFPANNNTVVPVLQTLNVLMDADLLSPLASSVDGLEVLQRLLRLASRNVDKLKSVQRIMESMKIVVNMISSPEVREGALSALPRFLQHKFPKIRADTAETLYMNLQTKEIEYNDEADVILLDTEWTCTDVSSLDASIITLLGCLAP